MTGNDFSLPPMRQKPIKSGENAKKPFRIARNGVNNLTRLWAVRLRMIYRSHTSFWPAGWKF